MLENTGRDNFNSISIFKINMSQKDFKLLSSLVNSKCGIRMPLTKKVMLESRLRKRLRALGLRSFKEYYDYVSSPSGIKHELGKMLDAVTTNKTDFFREPRHYKFLADKALPELINVHKRGITDNLMVWSAGCSSGEEPYSIAMLLHEFKLIHHGFNYSIIATDISTDMLKKAQTGIYPKERAEPVPAAYKKRYLLRSRNKSKELIRVIPKLRNRVRFQKLNFMDNNYNVSRDMDLIFCRNVLIYFNKPEQEQILKRICNHLRPGGYIFVGHAETLNKMDLPIVLVSSSVYRKE